MGEVMYAVYIYIQKEAGGERGKGDGGKEEEKKGRGEGIVKTQKGHIYYISS